MLRGKRGDATEIIMFLVIIFFLAVSFITVIYVLTRFKDVIVETPLNNSDASGQITDSIDTITTTTVQRGFVAMFAILIIGIMVFSFSVRVHPIFLFLYIIFLSVGILTAVFLSNIYKTFMEVDILASIASQQTMMTWIMQHIVLIMLGVGALSMVVLFSKIYGTGGYVETRL
jgi:hypothetical protein